MEFIEYKHFFLAASGGYSRVDLLERQLDDGLLSLEFQPEEVGLYEIRLFSDKTNHFLYNSFEVNVYDTASLLINASEEAYVGKLFTFTGSSISLLLNYTNSEVISYCI
jgi:hypothetical protein